MRRSLLSPAQNSARTRKGSVALALALALTSTVACKRPKPDPPITIAVSASTATVVDAVAAVEAALVGLPTVAQVNATVCRRAGNVEVTGVPAADVAAAVATAKLPPGASAHALPQRRDVAVFVVKASDNVDAFTARARVDALLVPKLRALAGVDDVIVSGGARAPIVQLDLARMLAAQVTVPAALAALAGPASLDALVVAPAVPNSTPTPSTTDAGDKAVPPPPPQAVRLADIALVGPAPVGPPLRRDGGIEVRVQGTADKDAVIAAAVADGLAVAVLDDDSVEAVDVVLNAKADVDFIAKSLLAIPGTSLGELPHVVDVRIDTDKAAMLGVPVTNIEAVIAAATTGATVVRNTENVTVRVETPSLEALSLLELKDGVRMLDVATLASVPVVAAERVNRDAAVRLRFNFGVGVRKNALTAVERATRSAGGLVLRRVLDADTCLPR